MLFGMRHDFATLAFALTLSLALSLATTPAATQSSGQSPAQLSDEEVLQLHLNASDNIGGQYDLGWYYMDVGNPTEAVRWWRLAAENQHSHGQDDSDTQRKAEFNLGVMHAEGQGVTQDYSQALEWFRRAADQNFAPAQFQLGVLYYDGQGVAQNYGRAADWFRRAASHNHVQAIFNLGIMYREGQGVLANPTAAAHWYLLAAKQNFPPAQFRLGVMHGNGEGVPQDLTQAYMWFSLAAAGGDTDAEGELEGLVEFMTDDQILEAQRRARALQNEFASSIGQ